MLTWIEINKLKRGSTIQGCLVVPVLHVMGSRLPPCSLLEASISGCALLINLLIFIPNPLVEANFS